MVGWHPGTRPATPSFPHGFSTAVLCFHRHSRFVPANKSSQLSAISGLYSPPWSRRGKGWLMGLRPQLAGDLRVSHSYPLFSTTFPVCSDKNSLQPSVFSYQRALIPSLVKEG